MSSRFVRSIIISTLFFGLQCTQSRVQAQEAATPSNDVSATREFEIRDGRPYLGGQPIRLWGLRCNNALMSPAVTERLVNNLDNYAEHGINFISISLQGTNGGFPNVDAGPNAFTPDGRLIASFAKRTETVIREADKRGMLVCLVVMMPRKDELLVDEAAVRTAIQQTATLLESRKLRNVTVNLFQEFHHPTRIHHAIFREPDGDLKKSTLTGWFKEIAPGIETGICPNHLTGSSYDYPGCEVKFFQEEMAIPDVGFSINTETADRDATGHEGVFNRFHIASMEKEWRNYLDHPNSAMLFRSPYVEDVGGQMGTGPNFEMGGRGTGDKDRGVRHYFEWVQTNVGVWKFPTHIRANQPQ
ncbi:MAG: hypothetical protein U0936_24025 [Planctomycetaceae bacterium]